MTLFDVDEEPERNYSALVYEVLSAHVRAFVLHLPQQVSVTLAVTWLWHRNVMLADMEKEGQEQGADLNQLKAEVELCLDDLEQRIFGEVLPARLRNMPSLVQDPEGWAVLAEYFARLPQLQVNLDALLLCLSY